MDSTAVARAISGESQRCMLKSPDGDLRHFFPRGRDHHHRREYFHQQRFHIL